MIRQLILRLKTARWKATHTCPYCDEEGAIHLTGKEGGGYYTEYNRYVETRRKLTFHCMACGNSWKKRMQPRGRGIPFEEDEKATSLLDHQEKMGEE